MSVKVNMNTSMFTPMARVTSTGIRIPPGPATNIPTNIPTNTFTPTPTAPPTVIPTTIRTATAITARRITITRPEPEPRLPTRRPRSADFRPQEATPAQGRPSGLKPALLNGR